MSGDEECNIFFGIQLSKDIKNILSIFLIEMGGGFIGDDNFRIFNESSCDSNSLELSSG